MKFFANSASIEYRKPQKGVAGALFSRLLALLIIAILLCANAGTAFAGETSSEAVLAGPTAGDTSEETVQAGSSSDESLADSALAGAESGQDAIGRDGDDRNVSGQEVIEQDDADQDISGQEDMRQDSGGRDVTVHFGEDEDRAIHIHVNSASGEEVESGMDDETGLEAETEEAKKVFFAEVPYDLHMKDENNFHLLFFAIFMLLGVSITAESKTNNGRIDAVATNEKFVFVFEFKLNKTAKIALDQIKDRDYYRRYMNSGKKIFLIGVNFDKKKGQIDKWIVKED